MMQNNSNPESLTAWGVMRKASEESKERHMAGVFLIVWETETDIQSEKCII